MAAPSFSVSAAGRGFGAGGGGSTRSSRRSRRGSNVAEVARSRRRSLVDVQSDLMAAAAAAAEAASGGASAPASGAASRRRSGEVGSPRLVQGLRIVTGTEVAAGVGTPRAAAEEDVFANRHSAYTSPVARAAVAVKPTGLTAYADMLLKAPSQRLPGELRVLTGFIEETFCNLPLTRDARKSLANVVAYHNINVPTILTTQGDKADTLYAIMSGEVQQEHVSSGGDVTRVTLGVGQTFGEAAMLTERPRLSTYSVHHSAELISITRKQYRNLVVARSEEEVQSRFESLKATDAFRVVPPSRLRSLAAVCSSGYFRKGQLILAKGAVPFSVYVIVSGRVSVTCSQLRRQVLGPRRAAALSQGFQSRTIDRKAIAVLEQGQTFGINCLLHREAVNGEASPSKGKGTGASKGGSTSHGDIGMPAHLVADTNVRVLMVSVKDLLKELARPQLTSLAAAAVRGQRHAACAASGVSELTWQHACTQAQRMEWWAHRAAQAAAVQATVSRIRPVLEMPELQVGDDSLHRGSTKEESYMSSAVAARREALKRARYNRLNRKAPPEALFRKTTRRQAIAQPPPTLTGTQRRRVALRKAPWLRGSGKPAADEAGAAESKGHVPQTGTAALRRSERAGGAAAGDSPKQNALRGAEATALLRSPMRSPMRSPRKGMKGLSKSRSSGRLRKLKKTSGRKPRFTSRTKMRRSSTTAALGSLSPVTALPVAGGRKRANRDVGTQRKFIRASAASVVQAARSEVGEARYAPQDRLTFSRLQRRLHDARVRPTSPVLGGSPHNDTPAGAGQGRLAPLPRQHQGPDATPINSLADLRPARFAQHSRRVDLPGF